ncbi:MAG: ABC transporter permease [Spirochaetales bacterium]|nr:ABC transporter permease [Spirochaetales bacterium]
MSRKTETVNEKYEKKSFLKILSGADNTLSLAIALLLLCIAWSILSPYFLTVKNIMNLFMFASILAIRASGLTVSMIMGGMDISQNSVGAVTALMCALVSLMGAPWWAVLLMAIGLGLLMGAINATLVSIFKIAAIITTLGTMQIFRGAAWLIKDATVMIKDPVLLQIGRGRLFGVVPYIAIIAAIILFIIHYVLKWTSFGRKVYMVGGNEQASYLSGINADRVKFIAFLISGLTAGIAGFLLACQVGAALPQSGAGTEMATVSAVILGGVSLAGGSGRILGTILGVMILQTINNGLTLLSVNAYYQMVVSGGVLLIAVLIDVIRSGALKKH